MEWFIANPSILTDLTFPPNFDSRGTLAEQESGRRQQFLLAFRYRMEHACVLMLPCFLMFLSKGDGAS